MEFQVFRTSGEYQRPCERCYLRNNRYMVTINDLDELIEFSKKYGEIIIYDEGGVPQLEIYDDWRE